MKRILINARQSEELRVAMVDGQILFDLDIELPGDKQKKSNIYKAKIVRIEPSLEAAFVDYGAPRHGFLPFREIAPSYFRDKNASSIKDALSNGQELIVQVSQDERGNKGAALTTYPSLPGRYLVLTPNNPRAHGISRQIEGEERDQLQQVLSELTPIEGGGMIIRTAGIGRSAKDLQWDLDNLSHLWAEIEKAGAQPAPLLIYSDNDAIVRALRDNLRDDIDEVLVDNKELFEQARDFVKRTAPQYIERVLLYEDATPLFSHYQIESQIESAHARVIRLPSGGTVAIDHTEALVSIDINSARATKGRDIEVTAYQTNSEAAAVIARQLRLRDLGGLIVIDFIDMASVSNQKRVENEFHDLTQMDRARVQIGRISRFGLLELSRQRLRPALGEFTQMTCPRCDGHGMIRTVQSLSLAILRLIEEEAMKENTGMVVMELPFDVTAYLLNEKRAEIDSFTKRHGPHIRLLPMPDLETPHYRIRRYREDDPEMPGEFNYQYAQSEEQTEQTSSRPRRRGDSSRAADKEPVIDVSQRTTLRPKRGLFSLITRLFTRSSSRKAVEKKPERRGGRGRPDRSRGGRGRGRPSGSRQGERRETQDREDREGRESRGGRFRRSRRGGRGRGRGGDNRGRSESAGHSSNESRGDRGGSSRRSEGAGRNGNESRGDRGGDSRRNEGAGRSSNESRSDRDGNSRRSEGAGRNGNESRGDRGGDSRRSEGAGRSSNESRSDRDGNSRRSERADYNSDENRGNDSRGNDSRRNEGAGRNSQPSRQRRSGQNTSPSEQKWKSGNTDIDGNV